MKAVDRNYQRPQQQPEIMMLLKTTVSEYFHSPLDDMAVSSLRRSERFLRLANKRGTRNIICSYI